MIKNLSIIFSCRFQCWRKQAHYIYRIIIKCMLIVIVTISCLLFCVVVQKAGGGWQSKRRPADRHCQTRQHHPQQSAPPG